jgi:hypothetical protein
MEPVWMGTRMIARLKGIQSWVIIVITNSKTPTTLSHSYYSENTSSISYPSWIYHCPREKVTEALLGDFLYSKTQVLQADSPWGRVCQSPLQVHAWQKMVHEGIQGSGRWAISEGHDDQWGNLRALPLIFLDDVWPVAISPWLDKSLSWKEST